MTRVYVNEYLPPEYSYYEFGNNEYMFNDFIYDKAHDRTYFVLDYMHGFNCHVGAIYQFGFNINEKDDFEDPTDCINYQYYRLIGYFDYYEMLVFEAVDKYGTPIHVIRDETKLSENWIVTHNIDEVIKEKYPKGKYIHM